MSEKYLALYLDAPLQSWGASSQFDCRTSNSSPTKSGIIGLLCASLGIARSDEQQIAILASLNMEVYILDPGSRMSDFHTIGADKDNLAGLIKTANEEKGGTVLTYREYLENAKFGILLFGQKEIIKKCAHALKNPKWGVWFGRKSCIPAAPIFSGLFETYDEGKQHLLQKRSHTNDTNRIATFTDTANLENQFDSQPDHPINFETRQFKRRWITKTLS